MNEKSTPTESDIDPIARAFEAVTERVCRSCPQNNACWGQCYTDTKNAFNDAVFKLRESGRASIETFPPYFTVRCIRITELTSIINESLSLAEASRQMKMQKHEDIRLMRAQYNGITAVIDDMTESIDNAAHSRAEHLKVTIGVGTKRKRGEENSGDTVSYFKTDKGELYMMISDGMGSGKNACNESGTFVRLLESFIKAGMRPDTALRMLCPAYAIKCGGNTFTTCDILRLDLNTGECEIYKCGAAPTYIKTGCTVRRVTGSSIPAGVITSEPIEADRTSLILHPGDTAIMVSDGVADSLSDSWLIKILTEFPDLTASGTAGSILEAAAKRNGCEDDLSIICAVIM